MTPGGHTPPAIRFDSGLTQKDNAGAPLHDKFPELATYGVLKLEATVI